LKKKSPLLGNLLVSSFTIVFTLLLLEIFFHFFAPQIHQHHQLFQMDQTLGWTFIPKKTATIRYEEEVNNQIRINENGFRYPLKNGDKKKKIFVIGDSFVSNIAVEESAVFTNVLAAKFNDVSVYNYGVNGYSLVQDYLLLQHLLAKEKPDLIVVNVFLGNDFIENTTANWLLPRPIASLDSITQVLQIMPPAFKEGFDYQPKESLEHFSHLWAFTKRKLNNIKARFSKEKQYVLQEQFFCAPNPEAVFIQQLRILKELIKPIANYTKENQCELLFTLAPTIVQVEEIFWQKFLTQYADQAKQFNRDLINKNLMEFALAKNIKMLDFFPSLYQAMDKNEATLYFSKEQHWTEKGNQLVADVLYDYLRLNYAGFN